MPAFPYYDSTALDALGEQANALLGLFSARGYGREEPAVLQQAKRSFPARISYNGLVFRHQPGEPQRPTQFFQAGVELLGLEDAAAGDAEILTLAVEALRVCGLKDFSLRIGDLALFGALVDALSLPPQWRS